MRIRLGPANFLENEMRGFQIGKRNVVIAKIDGSYCALDDWCNHAGCLLSGGRLEGKLVVCPCHEVGFDFKTGKNVTSPNVCDDQSAFSVSIEEGHIVLENFNLT